MGGYSNGRFPLSLFIWRGGNIYLTPSLNARWNEAVRMGLRMYGKRLYITGDIDGLGGWNGYRPYNAQVAYKQFYGPRAAAPGYSSHGGVYNGKQVFAVDVANWGELAPGAPDLAWVRFVVLMKMVGLTTNFVSPVEKWHVGDFNDPWVAPSFGESAGSGESETPPPPVPYFKKSYGLHKEKEMIALRINDGLGKFGPVGKTRTYLVGGGLFVDTTNHSTANEVSVIVQGYNAEGQVNPTPNLTYRELYDYAKGSNALTAAELAPYAAAAGV